MKAHIEEYNEDGASNSSRSSIVLCVDKKVHLRIHRSWFDTGDEYFEDYAAEVGPCTCGCGPEVELSDDHAELVKRFLNSSEPFTVEDDNGKSENYPSGYIAPLIYDPEAREYHYTEEVAKIPGKNRFRWEFDSQQRRG